MNKHVRKLIKDWGVRPYICNPHWDGVNVLIKGIEHELTPDHILVLELKDMLQEGEEFAVVSWRTRSRRRNGKWVVNKCGYPKCKQPGVHGHHIVYTPAVIIPLCEQHHKDITAININAADEVKRKLDNRHRWHLWSQWFKGVLQPVYTPRVHEWLKDWKSRDPEVAA